MIVISFAFATAFVAHRPLPGPHARASVELGLSGSNPNLATIERLAGNDEAAEDALAPAWYADANQSPRDQTLHEDLPCGPRTETTSALCAPRDESTQHMAVMGLKRSREVHWR